MAKKAATVNQWFRNRKRFANLFNVKVFGGKQIVKPEELEPIEGETHVTIKTKGAKTQEIHRYRDIVMRWKGKVDLMILACENQDKVNYAMPVRTMIYDGLSYAQQMKLMWDLRAKDESISEDEFLSRFHKDDKICPVLTLVFYFGEKEWDASLDLYGMFDIEEILRENSLLSKYIPNYSINLIDAERTDDLELFQSDLQMVFGLLKYRKDKQKLKEYFRDHKEFFGNVDMDTGMVIGSFVNSESIIKCLESLKKGEQVDMCKALEDWAAEERAEGRLEGRLEGRIEGRLEGKEEKLIDLISKKLGKGKEIRQIADEIEETVDVVKELMKKYSL